MDVAAFGRKVTENVEKVIVGKRDVARLSLVSPADGSHPPLDEDLILRWQWPGHPSAVYFLRLVCPDGVTIPDEDWLFIGQQTSVLISQLEWELLPDGAYYWIVLAADGDAHEISSPACFYHGTP